MLSESRMYDLLNGLREPVGGAQVRFMQIARGEARPSSDLEHEWRKFSARHVADVGRVNRENSFALCKQQLDDERSKVSRLQDTIRALEVEAEKRDRRFSELTAWSAFLVASRAQTAKDAYASFRTLVAARNRYAAQWQNDIEAERKKGIKPSAFWESPHFMADVDAAGGPDARPYGGLQKF